MSAPWRDRACNTLAGIEQTADVEPTSARTRAEVPEQRQFFPGVKEPREKRGPKTAAAKLDQSDRLVAVCVQLRREIPQDTVRILPLFVDKGGEVALGIEHGTTPLFQRREHDGRRVILKHISRWMSSSHRLIGKSDQNQAGRRGP